MKTTRLISFVMLLVMALTVFTACEIDIPGLFPGDPTIPNQPIDPIEVTVTWRQGQKVLKEETLETGSKATSWTPVVDGKEFLGWFADPGCTTAFDFEQVIAEDTDIYASFKTIGSTGGDDVEDPVLPDFYLIGSGKGDLSKSGWDHNRSAANLGMTAGANGVYTITIDMYAGDMFQIAHDLAWDGQVGLGHIPGAAPLADNENQGQVLDADGNVIFTGFMEYDNPIEKWNITLAEGQDGKYEFTYDSVNGVVTYKLIERLDPNDIPTTPTVPDDPNATIPVTLYFKNVSGWSNICLWAWNETSNFTGGTWPGLPMTLVDGTEDWYTIDIKVSALEGLYVIFSGSGGQTADLVYDADKIYWAQGTAYATQAEADEAASGYVPAPVELFVRGLGGDWGTPEDMKLVMADDGSYSITLTLAVGDIFKVADSAWSSDNTYGWHEGLDADCFKEAASDGNIEVLTAGEYVITVSPEHQLSITTLE